MDKHEKNIQTYLEHGGDLKLAARYKSPNLENRAKILFLISQMNISPNVELQKTSIKPQSENMVTTVVSEPVSENYQPPKPDFLGFVSQYPVELHGSYREAFDCWIEVCGLKIQLNAVPDEENDQAFTIQKRMFKLMEKFDRCKNALDYYNDFRRILPTQSKKDYSSFNAMELLKEKTNLAGLISRRKATIKNLAKKLPEKIDPTYWKKQDAINRKKETLEEMELDFEKLKQLLVL